MTRIATFFAFTLAFSATAANAQSIDEALRLYKAKDYEEAAFAFYDVMSRDANQEKRDQAEIYLAETLYKLDLHIPALYYYTDLFKVGRGRYYLNAVEGLLNVQRSLHDPLWVPALINERLDPEGFGHLDPEKIAQINYLVGELSFRQHKDQDARAFLEYVPPESPLHPKARYLLGLLDIRANDPESAEGHFNAVLELIEEDDSDEEKLRVRNLALLAAGRNVFGLGRFDEASKFFSSVPRFSEQWFKAMYENAWSYFRKEEYGQALGELQSVTAPYFGKRFIPEAYVIRGTTYFVNCQWDRVRRTVDRYKTTYEPMLASMKSYLGEAHEPAEYYRDVVAGGNGNFSIEVAREVRRSRRFKDYHFMLQHMSWERAQVDTVGVWKGSRLAEDIALVLDQHRDGTEHVAGTWAKGRISERFAQLQHYENQMNILDFEVADAERRWLEQGQEILKGRRARLPRPKIPNDQWQHWSFDREYWKDELGFIQHSLRSECF